MKKNFKVYAFEFGTVVEEGNQVKIEMEQSQFNHDTEKEITNLPTKEDPLFLKLGSVKESEASFSFLYEKSSQLKNLTQIKTEAYPVKLSIAQEILEQDIQDQYTRAGLYISLHPSTIYYHPMQTIRYTYVANRFMPRDNHTTIERYRALIVSLLSDLPYEKCLNSPKDVSKEGNELIKELYQQSTVPDLLALIKQSNDFITYGYIENRKKSENKIKRNYRYWLGGVVALSLVGFSLLGVRVSGQATQLTANYQQQLDKKDTLLRANEQFYKGNYNKAVGLYEKIDYDKKQLATNLLEKEQYQQALTVYPESLEQVIETSYANDQKEALLDLNGTKLSEKQQAKLEDEKGIINGDTTSMLNTLNFLKDEQTAVRLTNKFLEIGDMNNAKKVAEKYPQNEKISEMITIAESEKENYEQEQAEVQKQIDKKQKKIDESKDQKEKETLQKEIQDLKENIE